MAAAKFCVASGIRILACTAILGGGGMAGAFGARVFPFQKSLSDLENKLGLDTR